MRTYTIGDAAQRSGFSASALRFYEEIGLLDPAGRTASGYRLYDDESLARLAFIARAKQLGCSLEEITDLVEIRDGQRCGPVQRRFHALLTDKIRAADAQAGELATFAAQLRSSVEQLTGDPVDGPCGPDCACLTVDAEASPDIPIACTLEPGAVPERLAAWAAVAASATRRTAIDGGVRLELAGDTDLAQLGRLIGAEQRCCAFFGFVLSVDATGIVLEVHAPGAAADLLTDVFGSAV